MPYLYAISYEQNRHRAVSSRSGVPSIVQAALERPKEGGRLMLTPIAALRSKLIAGALIGIAALFLAGFSFSAQSASAQAPPTTGSCDPYDSACAYCSNHPTASICPATSASPGTSGGVMLVAQPGTGQMGVSLAVTSANSATTTATSTGQTMTQPSTTAGGCSAYDSACFYCQRHPMSPVCKPGPV